MSEFVYSQGYVASGPINVGSIVKPDTANDLKVLQAAGPNDDLLGIVQRGGAQLPIDGGSAPTAANTGGLVYCVPPGAIVRLAAGTAGWAWGDYITSDANGNGVTALPGQRAIAKALTVGVSGSFPEVEVLPPGFICPSPQSNTTGRFVVSAVSLTLTPAMSGSIIRITGTDKIATLPPVATSAGLRYVIYSGDTTAHMQAGTTGTLVKLNATDITNGVFLFASGKTAVAGDGICNTAATATLGDLVEVECDGTAWYELRILGTWAIHA